MSRKLATTPRSRVRAALRQLFLRSRERAAALKRMQHRCERCNIKASTARGREVKVQVHHRKGIGNWDKVIDAVFSELLCDPKFLEVLCVDCHNKEHADGQTRKV